MRLYHLLKDPLSINKEKKSIRTKTKAKSRIKHTKTHTHTQMLSVKITLAELYTLGIFTKWVKVDETVLVQGGCSYC